jgi:hypothetical protein
MFIHAVAFAQECNPCRQLYDRSVAIKKKCDGLADQAQSLCLDEYNRAATEWENCQLKALADGTAGACPVADKPKPPKPPLANCGFEEGTPEDVPVTIEADTIEEFRDIARHELHGVRTIPSYSHNSVLDEDGKVIDPQYRIVRHIISPRLGGTRAKPAVQQLMRKAAGLMRKHELGHASEFSRVAKQAACDAVGKTSDEADAVFQDFHCNKLPAAQKAVDMRDGLLVLKSDKQGNVIDVELAPFDRPLAQYTPPDCGE